MEQQQNLPADCTIDDTPSLASPTASAQLLAHPASANLIRQLTDPAPSSRRQTLEKTLDTVLRQASLPGQKVLTDRARLVAAALAIKDGDTDIARRHLRHIHLDSPSAVDATLLMAESWRRENNTDAALQWYLRAHNHFPNDPVALGALLGAAALFHEQGEGGSALALYQQLHDSAMTSLTQIDVLEKKLLDDGIDIILTSQEGVTPSLQRAVATQALRLDIGNILDASEEGPAAAQQLQCALHAYVALTRQSEALKTRLQPLRDQLRELRQIIAQREMHINDLKTMLATGRRTPEDSVGIRRAITAEHNILLREQAQHDALSNNISSLPEALSTSGQALAALISDQVEAHLHHNAVLENGLRQALAQLRHLVLDSAGHSQAGIAMLHDPM